MTELPFLDEHRVRIAAPPSAVWPALIRGLAGLSGPFAAGYTRLVSADPVRTNGTLPDEGATVPGFLVAESVPERCLRLTGRHRFSRYELTFLLDPDGVGTVLRARSRAEFPGLLGGLYRFAVIGTGGHGILVPRLLRSIGRRAESTW